MFIGHILDIWSQFEELFTTLLFIVLVALSCLAIGLQLTDNKMTSYVRNCPPLMFYERYWCQNVLFCIKMALNEEI
jgi:hypothetical protein